MSLNEGKQSSSINPISYFLQLRMINKLEFLTLLMMLYDWFMSRYGFAVMADANAVISEIIRGLVIIAIGTVFVRWRLGSNDFRFKMIVHILNIVINTQLVTAVVDGDKLGGINTFIYLSVILGHLIIVIISIFATFYLLEDYTQRLIDLSKDVKEGDLSVQIEETTFTEDKVLGPVTAVINEILQDSHQMFTELAKANQIIRTSYEQITSSTLEMDHSVAEVANTSNSMATGASQQAEMIAMVSEKIVEANETLNQVIGTIVENSKLVQNLALQTNILALNAGIEASRAGDYGRGFAVVAENVRRLSEESKKSSEEIGNVAKLIADELTDVFGSIHEEILNVSAVSEETSASAEELASASEELAANIEELSSMAREMSDKFSVDEKYRIIEK